jgi:acyl-CoA reductase-like NAD-dependent aldehyde dehydrogenase
MSYIDSGKAAGATVHHGGEHHGNEGFFIKPTIFTDVHPDMKIVKEDIFGPVAVIIKFKDEAEVVEIMRWRIIRLMDWLLIYLRKVLVGQLGWLIS